MAYKNHLFPTDISSMEPMVPERSVGELKELAGALIKKASSLGSMVHPMTAEAIKDLLRAMNSYYSNLIEGQSTHPISIEAALKKKYEKDTKKRDLQKLAVAHIETQKAIEQLLVSKPETQIASMDFLKFVHREFYLKLPKSFLEIEDAENRTTIKLIPGELRRREVTVGEHFPPSFKSLSHFLERFHQVYSANRDPLSRLIAGAAAHHRLAWIHPFLDGNGRVARLFSDSFFLKENVGGLGLWTISRGLARKKENYYSQLMMGDQRRKNDYDGRGALSDKALEEFCLFFLSTALDQVEFMSEMLKLDYFENRLKRFIDLLGDVGSLRSESFFLMRDLFLRGHIPRGETARIMGLHERVARKVVAELTEYEVIRSLTPKSELLLNFHPAFASFMFPNLYPEGLELTEFITGKKRKK